MKINVTLKDPDVLFEAIREVVENMDFSSLESGEIEYVKEKRIETIRELACEKWFKWGEYLTVEIDTDLKTCVVVPIE